MSAHVHTSCHMYSSYTAGGNPSSVCAAPSLGTVRSLPLPAAPPPTHAAHTHTEKCTLAARTLVPTASTPATPCLRIQSSSRCKHSARPRLSGCVQPSPARKASPALRCLWPPPPLASARRTNACGPWQDELHKFEGGGGGRSRITSKEVNKGLGFKQSPCSVLAHGLTDEGSVTQDYADATRGQRGLALNPVKPSLRQPHVTSVAAVTSAAAAGHLPWLR